MKTAGEIEDENKNDMRGCRDSSNKYFCFAILLMQERDSNNYIDRIIIIFSYF